MILSLTDLFRVALAAFLPSLTIASQTFLTPIPQDVNYRAMASGQISGGNFSTDVTRQGRVAAANDEPAPANLTVELIRTPTCALSGELLTYRIVITNTGGQPALNIQVQNQHPKMPISNVKRPTDSYNAQTRIMIWNEPALAPGDKITYTFQIPHVLDRVRDDVTVSYAGGLVKTYDFAADPCHAPIAGESPPVVTYSPLPTDAAPVIICDSSEASCVPARPTGLGPNFQKAKSPLESPDLGVRFQEAIADIIPGECRVVEDDIIASPAYQDALSRSADVSALFMRPLYNSGQDFKQLVQENALLDIRNFIDFQSRLLAIYTKHWQKRVGPLRQVLNNQLPTDDIRGRIDAWVAEWVQETQAEQQKLAIIYSRGQQEKKTKFDPVAAQALLNAKDAVENACTEPEDDGLEPLLPAVKKAYKDALDKRLAAFNEAQKTFSDPNNDTLDPDVRAAAWQKRLRAALKAFDDGNRGPLEDYIASMPSVHQAGFEVAWRKIYYQHQLDDEKADNTVRLQNWETALDTPKTVATDCQKEKDFKYQVATTWCESGEYPELIIKGAPVPAKVNRIVLPDTRSLDGTQTRINSGNVSGQACGKKPGDPWWASDCSCECGDIVPRDGPDPDNPIFVACESVRQITRHDYYVTTQAECLNDGPKHSDTFF